MLINFRINWPVINRIFLISCIASTELLAGVCEITTIRSACPGQEQASFAKCDGKSVCVETFSSHSLESCIVQTMKACQNPRPQITQSKVVRASHDGVPLANGKDFCLAKVPGIFDREQQFNQCKS